MPSKKNRISRAEVVTLLHAIAAGTLIPRRRPELDAVYPAQRAFGVGGYVVKVLFSSVSGELEVGEVSKGNRHGAWEDWISRKEGEPTNDLSDVEYDRLKTILGGSK